MNALQIVINTLELVEVKGSQNMDYMLGAIKLLKQIVDSAKQTENPKETEQPEGTKDAVSNPVQD